GPGSSSSFSPLVGLRSQRTTPPTTTVHFTPSLRIFPGSRPGCPVGAREENIGSRGRKRGNRTGFSCPTLCRVLLYDFGCFWPNPRDFLKRAGARPLIFRGFWGCRKPYIYISTI